MRVAAVQMTSTPDPTHNLDQAHAFLIDAVSQGAEFVAFPENVFLLTSNSKDTIRIAKEQNSVWKETLSEWAIEHDVWILGGSIPVPAPKGKLTNTSFLFSPEGKAVARYDKIHLFDADVAGDREYRESKTFKAGTRPVVARTSLGKVGLSICYDLRFPELYRKESKAGAQVLFVPAAFTVPTGQAHWDVLTRARAIENLCYVVAPAQWGTNFEGRETYGCTRIIDPWGRILAERPKGTGVSIADLDLGKLEEIRNKLPALEHRKL